MLFQFWVAVCFAKLIQVFDMFQRSDHAFDSCWRSIERRGGGRCAVSDTHAQWSWQRSCHSYHHPVIEQDWGCTINCRDFFSDQGQGTSRNVIGPRPHPPCVLESKWEQWEDPAFREVHEVHIGTRYLLVGSDVSIHFGVLYSHVKYIQRLVSVQRFQFVSGPGTQTK